MSSVPERVRSTLTPLAFIFYCAQVREAGSRALCFRTDVSDERQVNEMVERTLAEYGHIDIGAPVVGIAGPTKDLWDLSLAEWKQMLAVNLDSISCAVRRRCHR